MGDNGVDTIESMSKRITVAAGLYPPDIGGPATYARMIEEGLPGRGIELSVLPFGTVRSLPKIVRHLAYTWKLYRKTKDTGAVYALDSVSVGLPALLVARTRGVPLFIRLGGDYAWEQGRQRFGVTATLDEYTADRKPHGWLVRLLSWLQDLVVSRAGLVIVPSQYLKSIVTTWPEVKEERIKVIYSALFPLSVETPKTDLRNQLKYEGTVLISVGRLVPWKGFALLIPSLVDLQKIIPDVTLVIAGDGTERKALEALAKETKVADRVRFVGSLSKDALGAAIRAADIFVLNTGYEGLSHQILEVMDLGVPVVTTNVGGNPELVEDGVNGLLVPYNDKGALIEALVRMAESETLRERCTQNARLKVQEFSKEKVLDELAETINTLV